MIAGLRALQSRYRFDLSVVDIDSDPALYRLYDADVPVLVHGARELCRHHLDGTVEAYLVSCGRMPQK
jgi:hypothetical protein